MPIILAASTNLLVTSRSSRLGSTLPLGWLCASTTLAALARMAGLKTSLGCTREAESVPTEIVGNSMTSFLVFRSTATKFSRSRLAIRPLKSPSTSAGDDITGRPGLRTLPSRFPNSTAARVTQAFASPTPCVLSRSWIETLYQFHKDDYPRLQGHLRTGYAGYPAGFRSPPCSHRRLPSP